MPLSKNQAGLNIIGFDTPEGWDVFLSQNWNTLAAMNSVGGFALTPTNVDANLISTSLLFTVGPGIMLVTAGLATFAASVGIAAPPSATTYVWLDAAGAIHTGTGYPSGVFIPLGTVTTDAAKVTAIADHRNPCIPVGVGPIVRANAAPADADIANGTAAVWFDPTPGAAKFTIRARDSAGNLVTGTVPLA
jgi:hypothetical protein